MLSKLIIPIVLIAFTDITLQLDNAVAISTVASSVPAPDRLPVLLGGVLLAAVCLVGFTLVGSELVTRISWAKPVAGAVLVLIGAKLVIDYFTSA
jgi:predicted tellurium resistance membrane protein TerC